MKKIGCVLLTSSLLFTSTHLNAWWWNKAEPTKKAPTKAEIFEKELAEKQERRNRTKATIALYDTQVRTAIETVQEIPGCSAEQVPALRPKLHDLWERLVKWQVVEITGIDEEVRPQFQALQFIIEQTLISPKLEKDKLQVLSAFHVSPFLPPSLCIDTESFDPLDRLMQPIQQVAMLREMLRAQFTLHVLYLKNCLTKHTEEELNNYAQAMARHPEMLIDIPLPCEGIPTPLIGSLYFFMDKSDVPCVFASNMPICNNKEDIANFGLWFGDIGSDPLLKRLGSMIEFTEKYHKFSKEDSRFQNVEKIIDVN